MRWRAGAPLGTEDLGKIPRLGCPSYCFLFAPLSRTPGPFCSSASMKRTPAASSARLHFCTVPSLGSLPRHDDGVGLEERSVAYFLRAVIDPAGREPRAAAPRSLKTQEAPAGSGGGCSQRYFVLKLANPLSGRCAPALLSPFARSSARRSST